MDTLNLKQRVFPKDYYSRNLSGCLGKHTGNNWHLWKGVCPFHNDLNAGSFFINVTTGAFKCFSCGASGGDIIDFHQLRYGLTFKETINQLKGDSTWNA